MREQAQTGKTHRFTQNETFNRHYDALTPAQRETWAQDAGTSAGMLIQIRYGFRRPSMALCQNLAVASANRVPLTSWPPRLTQRQQAKKLAREARRDDASSDTTATAA